MTRTRLRDRILPSYTKGEEMFNMVSHIVGGAFGVAALVLCVVTAALYGNTWGVVSGAIYGSTMVLLYTMSSIYHGLRPPMAKKVFQVIDHCSIYLLIAGTYTPITLCSLRPSYPVTAWVIFGGVWGLAVLGITLNAIDLKGFKVFSMICYLGMGWCIVFALQATLNSLPAAGLWLLLAGGIAYTLGAVLYGLGKKIRYMHSVFHLFVVLGSILHFLLIVLFVMPG